MGIIYEGSDNMTNEGVGVIDVRTARQSLGMKLRNLAVEVGITEYELKQVERGLSLPSSDLLERLSRILLVPGETLASAHESLVKTPRTGEGYVTALPTSNTTIARRQTPQGQRLSVVDLFCGVGGFSLGFELTGQFQIVAGVDLLGDRLMTFAGSHPYANGYGQDIRTLQADTLLNENPAPHVVVGGPPCQGFSSIRPFRKEEYHDPRNNLFTEFSRIVDHLRPEWVVFENVVGLLTHRDGRTLREIQDAFESAGYRTSARVLNAVYYGLPQRRERLIIVGNRSGKEFLWPAPTHYYDFKTMVGRTELLLLPSTGLFSSDLVDAITVMSAIGDLPEVRSGESALTYQGSCCQTPYQEFIRNGAEALTLHEATAHSEKMLDIIRHAGANINALPEGMVTSGFSSCYSRLDSDEPSVTLTVNFVHPASNRCIHPTQHRALTPREGARLQGFFDTFQFKGNRSQVVKQIGNAVPPLLGKVIAQAILESE